MAVSAIRDKIILLRRRGGLELLFFLREGEKRHSEIMADVDVSSATLSLLLKDYLAAGLINKSIIEPNKRFYREYNVYSLSHESICILDFFRDFWGDV